MDVPDLLAFALLCLLAAFGAWTDIRERRLSNGLAAATLVAGLALAVVEGGSSALLSHAGHFALALALGLGLFAAGIWGGGDGKFYAAVAAWFPIGGFFNLAFAISLMGLAMLAFLTIKARGRLFRKDTRGVPYGVAIGAGAALSLGQQLW